MKIWQSSIVKIENAQRKFALIHEIKACKIEIDKLSFVYKFLFVLLA